MGEEALREILRSHYGLADVSLRFLRQGGSRTYLVEGDTKYILKHIGPAFAKTSRQSLGVMGYLDAHGFPVPKTLLTLSGEAAAKVSAGGEEQLIVLQEYIEGQEPDMEAKAAEIGALIGRLHNLLERYPEKPVERDKAFFLGRYLEFLRKKKYPRLSEYEELGQKLWRRLGDQSMGICHGDLHRGNLLEDKNGRIVLLDFDTVCWAPRMFDVMVLCDMTDYFRLKQEDVDLTNRVYRDFLSGYTACCCLTEKEKRSFSTWVAIRHFQLQATILEIHGMDCVKESFVDAQLAWLENWLKIDPTP